MNKKVAIKELEMGFEAPLVVSRIFDGCLYSGFFGRLDSERMKIITERMLEAVSSNDSEYIIIDLSNVELIDTAIAAHLLRLSNSLTFSGVQVILCGIKPDVAHTMSVVDIKLDTLKITKDLKRALEKVYELCNYKLVPIV